MLKKLSSVWNDSGGDSDVCQITKPITWCHLPENDDLEE
jgi:hypothetical protein